METFTFRGGGTASNLPEFVAQCIKQPADVAWHLLQGHLEPWFDGLGKSNLTRLVTELRARGGDANQLMVELLTEAGLRQAESLLIPETSLSRPKGETRTAPKRSLLVATDGSGQFHTLEKAVAAAQAGATIHLGRGTHKLKKGIDLGYAVTLVGDGMNATQIVAEQGDYVIRYEGDGHLGMFDLTIHWQGKASSVADVVTIRDAEVQIERCVFTGATYGEKSYGTGLELKGTAHGEVRECEMHKNGHGVVVSGRAQILLQANICRENKGCGIGYLEAAAGVALQNNCALNGATGIWIHQDAKPTIDGNVCQVNMSGGIIYDGTSSGTARENTCVLNYEAGIFVLENAHPTVQANHCEENGSLGIVVRGEAQPSIDGNTCSKNGNDGIYLMDAARPAVRNNRCQANTRAGIWCCGKANATIKANTCTSNAYSGIFVADEAQANLENNICEENGVGLFCAGGSASSASGNKCNSNGQGICVADRAHLTLEDNTCNGNKDAGVHYWGMSSGVIRQNRCDKNGGSNIRVDEDSYPMVISNQSRIDIKVWMPDFQSRYDHGVERGAGALGKYQIFPAPRYPTRNYSALEKFSGKPDKDKQVVDVRYRDQFEKLNNWLEVARFSAEWIQSACPEIVGPLDMAQEEYSKRAFSPFWDSLETAAGRIDSLFLMVYTLRRIKGLYITAVWDYEHEFDVSNKGGNFPPFFYIEAVADLAPLLARYQTLLRQGLTDYEFASIWEMIKTRKSISEGFRTVEQAINTVRTAVEDGFGALHYQIAETAIAQVRVSALQNMSLQWGLALSR